MNWYKAFAGTVLGAVLVIITLRTMGFLNPWFVPALLVVMTGSLLLHFVTPVKWVEFWAGVTFGSSMMCLLTLPFGEEAIGPWLFPAMMAISIAITFAKKFLHTHTS